MAGKLGTDFDSAQPSDSSMVRQGAAWIRDVKSRLKAFVAVLFNPETGDFKDNVIRSAALQDSGVTPGTYTEVTVNAKGLATAGANPVTQQAAKLYRAVFQAASGSNGYVDTDDGVTTLTGSDGTYDGTGAPYELTDYGSLSGSDYVSYTLTVPDGVRRLKVVVVGGGGGGHTGHSGGGACHVEGTMPVTPGSSVAVVVGKGGAVDQNGAPSAVISGSLAFEATGGTAGSGGADGLAVDPFGDTGASGDLSSLVLLGGNASTGTAGPSGSYLIASAGYAHGTGGAGANPGTDGIVVIEWVK